MALKDTIERLHASRRAPDDAGEQIAAWQKAVSALYDQISEWLDPYVADGKITLRREGKTAYEEATGDYPIDRLDIDVGDEMVRLDPRATIVIGAHGRIDMSHVGSGDPLMLILSGPDGHPTWYIVDPAERRALISLTPDNFEAALETLLSDYGPRPGLTM